MTHDIGKWIAFGGALFATTACGAESPGGSDEARDPVAGCYPGQSIACACPDGSTSAQVCTANGDSFGPCQCQGGTGGSSTPQGGGADFAGGAGSSLPCEVQGVLSQHCWTCHDTEPSFGAPMSLTTAADFRQVSPTDPSVPMGQMVLTRIHDDARPMPQPPAPRLSPEEAAVLESWIAAGAPDGSCAPAQPDQPVAPDEPAPPPPDPTVTCYELRANAGGSTEPYNVPQQADRYQCFTFAPPWGDAPVHLVSARAIIDNARVLHHWILYNNAGAVSDRASSQCSGIHSDAQFIAGWAPGGTDTEMPPDVGMAIPGRGFTLETHYNNNAGAQLDASGVEICVTEQLRPNEAAIHWLGTELIAGSTATGTCRPRATEPVTILTSSPHMHLQGRHMTTVINRAAGGTDVLIDVPFQFDAQVAYETPAVVHPGDTLTTTCTYSGFARFGSGTNEEMCYNFVLAYPAGQLAQQGSAIRPNNCTGL